MFGGNFRPEPYRVLRGEIDRLFDDFVGPSVLWASRALAPTAFPAVNIWEEGDSYFLEAECPGLAIENLDLSVVGNQLTLAGARTENRQERVSYHRRERDAGGFRRTVTLPVELDADKVEASLRNGILSVRLPKAESAKPRKIAVKTV